MNLGMHPKQEQNCLLSVTLLGHTVLLIGCNQPTTPERCILSAILLCAGVFCLTLERGLITAFFFFIFFNALLKQLTIPTKLGEVVFLSRSQGHNPFLEKHHCPPPHPTPPPAPSKNPGGLNHWRGFFYRSSNGAGGRWSSNHPCKCAPQDRKPGELS